VFTKHLPLRAVNVRSRPRGEQDKRAPSHASYLYTPFMTADDAREPIADEERVKKGRALFVWHAVIAIVGVFAANARRDSA